MRKHLIIVLPFMIGSLLLGCTTRPAASEFPRNESYAINPDTPTQLRDALAPLKAEHASESGVRLIATGMDAFVKRIALIEAAQKSVDLQYYSVRNDRTGKLIMEALLRAADRGVRVRLLVDNLSLTNKLDEVIGTLNAHKNIQIRVFNPTATKAQPYIARVTNFFTDFDNFTRRMHNKAMIADSQAAIVGGRNLGDEYFNAGTEFNFRDMDVLAVGPIVMRVANNFDQYWNSEQSYPLAVLYAAEASAEDIKQTRAMLHDNWEETMQMEESKDMRNFALILALKEKKLGLTWAKVELASDKPEKLEQDKEEVQSKPARRLDQLLSNAKEEFIIVSPYFVPREEGVEWLSELAKRGIKVRVITNSLGSTDVVAVNAGYSQYRADLLKNGVELYEIKPTPGVKPDKGMVGSSSRASLHAKVYVIDRKEVVIGSFNLDPRSIELNTEMALVIHSPAVATQVAKMFDEVIGPKASFKVELADPHQKEASVFDPSLQWVTEEEGQKRIYTSEPPAGIWRSIENTFFSFLPVENQL